MERRTDWMYEKYRQGIIKWYHIQKMWFAGWKEADVLSGDTFRVNSLNFYSSDQQVTRDSAWDGKPL